MYKINIKNKHYKLEASYSANVPMSGVFILALTALRLGKANHNYTGNELYYDMPRFWTSTGFCPTGRIIHEDITASLLSAATRQQLRHIAALPTGAITHIRIHWLLELIQFVQYTQSGIPIYDFGDLDAFLMYLDEDLNLQPVIEFMANPGNVFINNPSRNGFLWADFSFQITKHYLNLFGAKKVLGWRFETWNEPDLKNYNRLNLTIDDYLTYTDAIRQGLNTASRRPVNSLHFLLRGPAGLFKAKDRHPLCWHILEYCNSNMKHCPFDIITYHRKGNGTDSTVIIEETSQLLQEIFEKYPALKVLPISNDEADPISDWSMPRDFQADVRYAAALVSIVVLHWSAKIEREEFKQLETISHDNAFLSYHPYEFSQRTMLAHFRMNQTRPPHSQFIQKPVYAAMGLLGKLAAFAALPEQVITPSNEKIWLLKTTVADTAPLYMSWLLVPQDVHHQKNSDFIFESSLPYKLCQEESYAYIVEVLEQNNTDPAYIWNTHQSPPYPDAALRDLMRRRQTPRIHQTDQLKSSTFRLELEKLQFPWIILLRVCSNLVETLKAPQKLAVDGVTHNEVLLTWQEATNSTQCLKSYEVWFHTNESIDWHCISQGWHLPFPSFQFAPLKGVVNGFYKVRGFDIFKRYSRFSDIIEYFEV